MSRLYHATPGGKESCHGDHIICMYWHEQWWAQVDIFLLKYPCHASKWGSAPLWSRARTCFDLESWKGDFPIKNKEVGTLVFWVGWPWTLFISMNKHGLLGTHMVSYVTLRSDYLTIRSSPSGSRRKEVWIKWIRLDQPQTLNQGQEFTQGHQAKYTNLQQLENNIISQVWLPWFSKHLRVAGGMLVLTDVDIFVFKSVNVFWLYGNSQLLTSSLGLDELSWAIWVVPVGIQEERDS